MHSGVYAVCMRCVCGVYGVCMRCVCGVHSGVYAVCMRCVCGVYGVCIVVCVHVLVVINDILFEGHAARSSFHCHLIFRKTSFHIQCYLKREVRICSISFSVSCHIVAHT